MTLSVYVPLAVTSPCRLLEGQPLAADDDGHRYVLHVNWFE
jgi:hypothetical protein